LKNSPVKKKFLNPELVTQSSDLIKAAQPLSIAAKRVFLMLIAQINPNEIADSEGEMDELTIYVVDYIRLTGSSSASGNAYADVRRGAKELLRSNLKFRGDGGTTTDGIIQRPFYGDGEGYLRATFSPELRPHLINLESYGKLMLTEVMPMQSMYSVRIFEQLILWRDTGIYIVDVPQLREILMLQDKYALFSNLRQHVIEPSLKEINKRTGCKVTYNLIKKGRKISKIHFKFKLKKDSSSKKQTAAQRAIDAINAGKGLGFGSTQESQQGVFESDIHREQQPSLRI